MLLPPALELIKKDPFAWSIYSRSEEYDESKLDAHSRFTYEASSYKKIDDPIVSRRLLENGLAVEYPEKKDFAVVLTHDVDLVYPSGKRSVLSSMQLLRRLDIRASGQALMWRTKGKEASPYRNFKQIRSIEEKFGCRSTFFFMTDGPDSTGSGYPVEELASDISQVADEGWEVGLHGGYGSYASKEKIANEKLILENLIGRKVVGYRNHFLRFKVPDTWRALRDCGFLYDTTMGYAEQYGFRNGMIHPFKPYDGGAEDVIDIIELPLAVMDCTLATYLGLSPEQGWAAVTKLLSTAKETNGVLVVLWHNDTFANPQLKAWASMYERLLDMAKKENGWLCSGSEMARWWQQHGF